MAKVNKEKRFPQKNMAFKFTYNNGGIEENGIGFLKTCSDAFIQQNIKAKRVWCANDGCLCRNYFDGEISRDERKESYIEELDFLISSGNTQWAGDIVRLTRKGFRYLVLSKLCYGRRNKNVCYWSRMIRLMEHGKDHW